MNSISTRPPRRCFSVPERRPPVLLGDAPAHVGDIGDEPVGIARPRQHARAIAAIDRSAERRRARRRRGRASAPYAPRSRRARRDSGGRLRGSVASGPLRARGPQPHVDLVEIALGGQRRERVDDALRKPRVIGRDRKRLRPVRRISTLSGAS